MERKRAGDDEKAARKAMNEARKLQQSVVKEVWRNGGRKRGVVELTKMAVKLAEDNYTLGKSTINQRVGAGLNKVSDELLRLDYLLNMMTLKGLHY